MRRALRPRRMVPLLAVTALGAAAVAVAVTMLADEASFLPAVLWTIFGLVGHVVRPDRARGAHHRHLGARPHLRQPAHAAADDDPRAAVAAVVRDVPVHQRRGLGGRLTASTAESCGWSRCCSAPWPRRSCWCGCPRRWTAPTTTSTTELLLRPAAARRWSRPPRAGRGPRGGPGGVRRGTGYERWNLVLVLVVIQAAQVLLLALSVLRVLHGLRRGHDGAGDRQPAGPASRCSTCPGWATCRSSWCRCRSSWRPSPSLYLTVSTVTDETYRAQFFGSVCDEMERAVGVRAVYLALRATADPSETAR